MLDEPMVRAARMSLSRERGIAPGSTPYGNGTGIVSNNAIDPITGNPVTFTIVNNQFYNIANANWKNLAAGAAVTMTGNTALTTFQPQRISDPMTGSALTIAPGQPGYTNKTMTSMSMKWILTPTLNMQIALSSSPTIGTVAETLHFYDEAGIGLTGTTWSMPNTSSGKFAINRSAQITVASAGIPDGLKEGHQACGEFMG